MGQITASTGLVSGIATGDLVDQLIALKARPRDLISARVSKLKNQQLALGQLTASVLGAELAADPLGKADLFSQTKLAVSNTALLSATVTGEPAVGSYQFTPVRQAQTQQLLSTGFAARDQAIGAGTLKFRVGGAVDESRELQHLNGGAGVQRGRIKITDRSGSSTTIDLRFAQTVDDVLDAINSNDDVRVAATVSGDSFQLVDLTGETVSNLRVSDVGLGTTAADLGLANINTASDAATGADVLHLYSGLSLGLLNDGSGVSFKTGLSDLDVTLRDGSSLSIDFHAVGGTAETTLSDLVNTINAADETRLRAEIAGDGDRLQLTDLTTDNGGTFSITSANGGEVAEDLGLTGTAVNGVITSGRLLFGLKSTLLSSLNGGRGLGTLGSIQLTDRSGATDAVDLSAAESLEDVIAAINAAGVGITAAVNQARDGLQLTDTTGSSASHLVVSSNDATDTAATLGLEIDAATSSVNGGSLAKQSLSENTKVSTLNGGNGLGKGSFLIYDSNGGAGSISLTALKPETIGDVIDAINALPNQVEARINDTGDGIVLVDLAGGSGTLHVTDLGNGTAAASLKLAGSSETVDINGTPTQIIDGTTAITLEITATDTLDDVVEKLNALDAGLTASVFSDGSGATPHRLSLLSNRSGKAGEILIDTSGIGFQLQEVTTAQDALIVFGAANGGGVLASSTDGKFDNVLDGVSITVNGASTETVTIDVTSTDEGILKAAGTFVEQYNRLVDKLDELTFFNADDGKSGVLFGTLEALRVENDLANLLTGRIFGAGSIRSLEEVGISITDTGTLELDTEQLKTKLAEDGDAVEEFFTSEETGFAARFKSLTTQLAGEDNSLLLNRVNSLQTRIDDSNRRIEFLNEGLEVQRELLQNQFYQMELAISRLRSNTTAISQIQALAPNSVNLA